MDAEADAPPDGDAEADAPAPSNCSYVGDSIELTPWPLQPSSPRLASSEDSLALAWLEGDQSPFDVMVQLFDHELRPLGQPVPLATARDEARWPEVVWFHDSFLIFWVDGENDPQCTAEICHYTLNVARIDRGGTVISPARTLWPEEHMVSRVAVAPTPLGAVVAVTAGFGATPRTRMGRIDRDASTEAGMAVLIPDRTARQMPPAAVAVGDRVVIVAAVTGSLTGVTVEHDTGVRYAGPVSISTDVSASNPYAIPHGDNAVVAFVRASGDSSAATLAEINDRLEVVSGPTEVSPGARWPQAPMVADMPSGWFLVWSDARKDTSSDCVNTSFCRYDVFGQSATLSGPLGGSLDLSEDPHHCADPSVATIGQSAFASWATSREGRQTAFGRILHCEQARTD